MRIPVMRMGLIGFRAEEQQYLGKLLQSRSALLHWQPWPFMEADALWFNGVHAQPLHNELVRVPSGEPTSRAIQLNLKEVDRPVAFSLPLAGGIQVPHTFDPHSTPSVATVLQRFEAWLQPLVVQLALSEALYARRGSFTAPVYHLTRAGTCIGIVDLHGMAGVAADARAVELLEAEWSGRPAAANAMPPSFRCTSVTELMWQHVLRTGDDLLPARYRHGTIYFRRLPPVASRLVKDVHLVLLRELASAPQGFQDLQAHTGLAEAGLVQALGALYFGGCITTDAKRAVVIAGRAGTGHEQSSVSGIRASSLLDADSRFRPAAEAPPAEWTVPASIEPLAKRQP